MHISHATDSISVTGTSYKYMVTCLVATSSHDELGFFVFLSSRPHSLENGMGVATRDIVVNASEVARTIAIAVISNTGINISVIHTKPSCSRFVNDRYKNSETPVCVQY